MRRPCRYCLTGTNRPSGTETGLVRDENGELCQHLEGLTLEESVSKEDLIQELYVRSKLTGLAISQLDHQSNLIIAQQAEIKLMLRDLFFKQKHQSNSTLVEALQRSRISVPDLFGPVPDWYIHKIRHFNFAGLHAPWVFSLSGPSAKGKKSHKFPAGPSGYRGGSSRPKVVSKPHSNKLPKRSRGSSKNARGGGRGKSPRVSLPPTRGATSAKSKIRTKGGKSRAGRGRGA